MTKAARAPQKRESLAVDRVRRPKEGAPAKRATSAPQPCMPANIIEAMTEPTWWGPWFMRGDWSAWQALLRVVFALPLSDADQAIFRECTGRDKLPTTPVGELWAVCGRRAGKSRVLALILAWLAVFVDWSRNLAPGEKCTLMLLAADRRQARVAMRYLRSLILDHSTLSTLVERVDAETIELKNRVIIEIATSSYRSTRGYSVAAVICDEVAFWYDGDTSQNPASEVIGALRPAMATLSGSMLLAATSPYARRGVVWETYRRHWGKDGDVRDVLVWKAPTRTMNPSVPQSLIDTAIEADPASASAEYMAEFRTDVETFVSREVVEVAVSSGLFEVLPALGVNYAAFTDPSGGSSDSWTVAIAHRLADGVGVLDAVREFKPPFSPRAVAQEIAALLQGYGVRSVVGDKYAGEFPRELLREHQIDYKICERTKSDLYRELLPLLNSRRVELLDHPRLVAQLVGLERRTSRAGRDSIDHAVGGHDDIANSVAGVLVAVAGSERVLDIWERMGRGGADAFPPPPPPVPKSAAEQFYDLLGGFGSATSGVVVNVTRPFNLTLAYDVPPVVMRPGVRLVEPEVAEHPYAVGSGVTRYTPPWPIGDVLATLPALVAEHPFVDADVLVRLLGAVYGAQFDAKSEGEVRALFDMVSV